MSNKSGASEQIISLPKGGGALHGIGEKFSPDLFTGTGNFTVPIALPPGRNGFQPQLNLVYSTGDGNSLFGLGWSLSIPGVTRKTSHGIPRYHDYDDDLSERDTFILSGAEDLVPVSENNRVPGIDQYRPRTEVLFALIEHHHDAANNYWKVGSKDGLASIYGHDPAAWVTAWTSSSSCRRGRACIACRQEDFAIPTAASSARLPVFDSSATTKKVSSSAKSLLRAPRSPGPWNSPTKWPLGDNSTG